MRRSFYLNHSNHQPLSEKGNPFLVANRLFIILRIILDRCLREVVSCYRSISDTILIQAGKYSLIIQISRITCNKSTGHGLGKIELHFRIADNDSRRMWRPEIVARAGGFAQA